MTFFGEHWKNIELLKAVLHLVGMENFVELLWNNSKFSDTNCLHVVCGWGCVEGLKMLLDLVGTTIFLELLDVQDNCNHCTPLDEACRLRQNKIFKKLLELVKANPELAVKLRGRYRHLLQLKYLDESNQATQDAINALMLFLGTPRSS